MKGTPLGKKTQRDLRGYVPVEGSLVQGLGHLLPR
jgi:hypothetical protein